MQQSSQTLQCGHWMNRGQALSYNLGTIGHVIEMQRNPNRPKKIANMFGHKVGNDQFYEQKL